jgi:hypothetical protein
MVSHHFDLLNHQMVQKIILDSNKDTISKKDTNNNSNEEGSSLIYKDFYITCHYLFNHARME